MSDCILKFQDVHKKFETGEVSFNALVGVNLSIYSGEFVGLSGKSGSGKTSLLNIAGMVDWPSAGKLFVNGVDVKEMNDTQLSKIRANDIGFIFQSFNLFPLLSAIENVEYPLMILDLEKKERLERAHLALKKVGLENFVNNRPSQLSGGQRQRVAIARAIVKNPKFILADEPTANLDSKTSNEVFDLLVKLQSELNVTVMLCSHDPELISKTERQIYLSDGKIYKDIK